MIAQVKRRLDHKLPRDALTGIQVEDQRVGVLYVVNRRRSGVHLDDADFDQAEEAGKIVHP